jgi:hypothetical protein
MYNQFPGNRVRLRGSVGPQGIGHVIGPSPRDGFVFFAPYMQTAVDEVSLEDLEPAGLAEFPKAREVSTVLE